MIIIAAAGCTRQPEPLSDGKVIVLMYHRITGGEATNLYERSAVDFEADLKYLRNNNISVISFEDLEEMVASGVAPANDCAIITFDDGDHSWYTTAMPLLIRYRMGATFLLWVSMIDSNRDSFLSWKEVELMSNYADQNGKRPFVFGSHTLYHSYLMSKKTVYSEPSAFALYLDEELGVSGRHIESHTPASVTVLSLPFGDGAGDADIIAAAKRNGYRFIRTSEQGVVGDTGTDLFRIPSLPMLDNTDPVTILTYLGR